MANFVCGDELKSKQISEASKMAEEKSHPGGKPIVVGPKNADCISKNGMVCCPCSEGVKYSYFAPTQCYVPMEYYVPVQCCVPVECEIRYGTPFIPGSAKDGRPCTD